MLASFFSCWAIIAATAFLYCWMRCVFSSTILSNVAWIT